MDQINRTWRTQLLRQFAVPFHRQVKQNKIMIFKCFFNLLSWKKLVLCNWSAWTCFRWPLLCVLRMQFFVLHFQTQCFGRDLHRGGDKDCRLRFGIYSAICRAEHCGHGRSAHRHTVADRLLNRIQPAVQLDCQKNSRAFGPTRTL